MIWIVNKETSHAIVSTNLHDAKGTQMHEGDKRFQLWATRPNGKSIKVFDADAPGEVVEVKQAIDYAIEHGQSALRLE